MSNGNYQQLVDYLIAADWPICEASVESVQIKAETIKVNLVVEGEAALHALADAAGGTVLLVVGSVGKSGAVDAQADMFVPSQEDDGENSQAATAPAFNPETDMPPDDDLSEYENPLEGEEDDGIFDEVPGKPPFQ